MAGGKLSPRQKMINMMYLVLTALLALNVSAEILESFQNIADSLEESAAKFSKKNHDLGENIIATIKKEQEGGDARNAALVPLVKEVETKTDEVIAKIDAHLKELYKEEIAGTDEEIKEHLKVKGETERNYRYWMISGANGRDTDNDGHGSGKGKELREMLNGYVKWANDFYVKNSGIKDVKQGPFKDIAIEPKDNPRITHPETKGKSWEYYTFHGAPAVANLAILQKFKTDVNIVEADLLETLKARLSQIVFKIDQLMAVDAPVSEYVVAGLPFKTRLSVAISSKEIKPKFSGSGRIETKENGNIGEMTIMANGSVIPKGKSEGEQGYSATISVPKADGSMEVLKVNKKFKVRRPEVQITSAAIQIMYMLCANDINVDVPALGELYNPVITARGGEATVSPKSKRLVRVVPTASKLQLVVSTRTNGQVLKIDEVEYRVIPPPKPTVHFAIGNNEWNSTQKINPKATVRVILIPDQSFARALPNDARYFISGIEVLRKPGLGAPVPVKSFGKSGTSDKPEVSMALATFWTNPNRGEQIYFRIKGISRVNYKGQDVEEKFTERELTVGGYIE